MFGILSAFLLTVCGLWFTVSGLGTGAVFCEANLAKEYHRYDPGIAPRSEVGVATRILASSGA